MAEGSSSILVTRMPLAPHSSAKEAKSGLCREVCQTSKSAARCSFEIFAQLAVVHQHVSDVHAVLHGGGHLHGVLTETTVAKKQNTTGRSAYSGWLCVAAQQPIAAGNEKPIDPR